MLTIKWTDRDGYERIVEGEDVSAKMDGKQAKMVTFRSDKGHPRLIDFPTTVYVMSAAGATVGKYVVCPGQGWINWDASGRNPVPGAGKIEYKMSTDNDERTYVDDADELNWGEIGSGTINHYRVVP